MSDNPRAVNMIYSGYNKPKDRPVDDELSRVGPGTPAGEYLRRFWHPIMMTARLTDKPMAIRILGEDLVLYRDLSGDIGLVHKHCSHRGMSLEYGIVATHGIRCAYHAWCFNHEGRILTRPARHPAARSRSACSTAPTQSSSTRGWCSRISVLSSASHRFPNST